MARPRKSGLDYFPHDTDAVNDEKIEALRALYGNDGYAFYFILLERIYRTNTFEIDISDLETRQILAGKTGISLEKFELILQTALNHGCFDKKVYSKKGVLTSSGIKKRAAVVVDKRRKMRDIYEQKKQGISDAEIEEENLPEMLQSKVKKSKSKDKTNRSKVTNTSAPDKKEYAPLVCLTEQQYGSLVDKFGKEDTEEMLEILSNYKAANGKQYVSDYHAVLNWVVRRLEDDKQKNPLGGQHTQMSKNVANALRVVEKYQDQEDA